MTSMEQGRPVLRATASNVGEYRRASRTLTDHLLELKEMTEKYPVYFTFAGIGYVFESATDIDNLIDELSAEIQRYEAAA